MVHNWLELLIRSVGAFEAKNHLDVTLLDAVSVGEPITITRHGRPEPGLVPATSELRDQGRR